MAKQEKTPMTRPMPKQTMGVTKLAKAVKKVKAIKQTNSSMRKMC